MEDIKEIRINDNRILLKNNRVKSAILPKVTAELDRSVVIQGNCIIEGALFAHTLEIENGPVEIQGAVFTQLEVHVDQQAKGKILFKKAVGSADSIASLATGVRVIFLSDINAKQIKLKNAFVSGSIFADEVELENCVVIGGVFAARSLELTNCILGTFNSPVVRIATQLQLLLPSAFSVEKIITLPGTVISNLVLADLGAIFKGEEQSQNSGKIIMNLETDELKTVLTSEDSNQILRGFSVAGKVLAADLLNTDKLNNHFLLTAASLGNQLIQTYDLGVDKENNKIELTTDRLVNFFFDLLNGKYEIKVLSGKIKISDITNVFA